MEFIKGTFISATLLTAMMLGIIYLPKPFGLTETNVFYFWILFILNAIRLNIKVREKC